MYGNVESISLYSDYLPVEGEDEALNGNVGFVIKFVTLKSSLKSAKSIRAINIKHKNAKIRLLLTSMMAGI